MKIASNYLSLEIRPLGAKMASLIYNDGRAKHELLYVPQNIQLPTSHYPYPKRGDIFDEKQAWGGDICAPSVSKCEMIIPSIRRCQCNSPLGRNREYVMNIGDHGDFWTTEFKVIKQSKTSAILTGRTKEFQLEVAFSLQGRTLKRRYRITNLTKYRLPFTFADHLLLPIPDQLSNQTYHQDVHVHNSVTDYIDLPNVKKMRVEWSFADKLGKKNDTIVWQMKRKKPFADKLFAALRKGKNREFSVSYNNYNRYNGYKITLSSKELSWIGYWHTEGGWNNQSNLGLELTNTDRDNLMECIDKGTVWWIDPGKNKKWSIDLEIKLLK